jgi:hypothetical protein
MGEEIEVDSAPLLSVSAIGTGEIESIEIRRGVECAYRHHIADWRPGRRVRVAWTGARILDRNRQQVWTGGLQVRGARIVAASPYGIDTPVEGISDWSATHVAWRSRTAGDEDGVVIELDDPVAATISFESPVVAFEVAIADVGESGHTVEAGGIGRRVVVERLTDAPAPTAIDFTWRDPAIEPGWNAYHVRLKQRNGALAWTSPLFVHFGSQ